MTTRPEAPNSIPINSTEKRLYTAKAHATGRETTVRTLCVLVLIGITTMLGYSQETVSDYVSPSEAVPRGKAPKMQVQLLNSGETTKQYAVIFYQGDEALSGLLEFAESVSSYECSFHRDRGGEWSHVGVVRSPTQNV
jgi:hypothetical protein